MEQDICGLEIDMDRKFTIKSYNKIFAIFVVILIILTSVVIYYFSKSIIVLIIFLFFCLLIGISIFLLLKYTNNKIETFSDNIYSTIDNMIEGVDNPINLTYDEEFLSRINHNLFRLYEILNSTKEEASNDKLKLQQLISDITHQVKTPITTMKLTVSTMENNIENHEKNLELLNMLNSYLDKLEFLLNSLITVSRLEAGIIKIEPTKKNIGDTILKSLENIIISASKKDIDILFEYSDDYYAVHDKKWTVEALSNILDNAVKYSFPNTNITIKVSYLQNYCKVTISDKGIGIKNSEINNIFKRFYREQRVREYSGVGIGLYLSRDIIERQNGFINVISEIDKGSTFEILLPKDKY